MTFVEVLEEFVAAARIVDQGHVVLVELERRRQRELERDRAWEEEHRATLRVAVRSIAVAKVKCPRCGRDAEKREGTTRLVHAGGGRCSGPWTRRKAA